VTFLNPILALAGLACVAVPILIHILMRRRCRPVAWGAMQFLMAAYRQQRRRMNFEQWLLLASRCLIVALVALAVGKPVLAAIGAGEGRRARTLFVLLDNSLNSGVAPGAGAWELDALKTDAKAMLASLSTGRGDRAALVTLAGPAGAAVMPPAPDAAQVAVLVDRVQPAASRADLEGAVRLVQRAISEEKSEGGTSSEAVVAVLSRFRAGSADLSTTLDALSTSTRRVRVIAASPAAGDADNVTIRAVEPLRSLLITGDAQATTTGSLPVRVDLSRSGATGTGVTQVRAWIGGASGGAGPERAAASAVSWNPGQHSVSVFLSVDAGEAGQGDGGDRVLRVETSADALLGDNTFIRPLESVATLRVALIAPNVSAGAGGSGGVSMFASQDWLALALSPQTPNPLRALDASGIRVEVVDPARLTGTPVGSPAPELAGAGAVVVAQPHTLDAGGWRAVASSASRGAFVMVVPPEGESVHTWTDAMNDSLGLSWRVSREAKATGAEGLAVTAQATLSPEEDLLGLVRPEFEELVKVVRVKRMLTLDSGGGASSTGSTVLALADGTPLVVTARGTQQGGGLVALWLASPAIGWTDLPAKPLMVPLIQELVRQGAGRSGPRRTVVAGVGARAPSGAAEVAQVDGTGIVRVAADGSPLSPLRESGLWRVRSADGRTLSLLAVNHEPKAGDATPQRSEDVRRWLSGLASDVSLVDGTGESGEGSTEAPALGASRDVPPVSLPLLIAAGIVAVLEMLFARWFSHSKVTGGMPTREGPGAGGSPA
jgi:hypothetical protein